MDFSEYLLYGLLVAHDQQTHEGVGREKKNRSSTLATSVVYSADLGKAT